MNLNGSNGTENYNNLKAEQNYETQEIDLKKILNYLIFNKWKLVAFILVGGVSSYIYTKTLIPIYSSHGTIIISQNQNRYSYAGSDLSSLLTTTYGIGVGSTIANELQILESRKQSYELAARLIAERTDKNGDKFPILWAEYPVDSTDASVGSVAFRYRQNISFSIEDPRADVVRITFQSPSPHEAARVVNLTMEAYSSLSTDQNRAMAISALNFLDEEKTRIENELETSEEALKAFMNKTNLIAIDPQSQDLINDLSTYETDKQSTEVLLVSINSGIEQYEAQLNEIRPGIADQYAQALGPTIERFQFAIAELETEKLQYYSKNPSITDSNPEIVRLNNEIQTFKDQIVDMSNRLLQTESDIYLGLIASPAGESAGQRILSITTQLAELSSEKYQLETKLEKLDEYITDLNSRFEQLPNEIIELSRLQRDVKINEELFLLVANQLAEMSLWEKTQFGMGRRLDDAIAPLFPIKPDKFLYVMIGLFMGGVFGLSFIFVREAFNDKINSTDTIKDFKLPLLGTIPDFSILDGLNSDDRQFIDDKSVSNQLITFLDHISPISEAYRRLRINVIYANPDKNYRVIMVTSATKGEGKSTLAANLAVTFSEAEKSVLIIDLDLRRPTQHKIFGENREPGLTDSLFETIKISDITRETIAPNVDLITVGKKTPEPATVLDSKRLKQLIDKLSERYDHIILDTAPYGIISDSASLLRLVDGIVVVSRFNVTTKRELKYTLEGLGHLNADVLGVVLNAFDPKRSTDYYTNYSYYKRTYSEYYQEEV